MRRKQRLSIMIPKADQQWTRAEATEQLQAGRVCQSQQLVALRGSCTRFDNLIFTQFCLFAGAMNNTAAGRRQNDLFYVRTQAFLIE